MLKAILFDLDETLYLPETGMLAAGDRLITEYLSQVRGLPWEQAEQMRLQLTEQYGTTAAGMEAQFGIPQADFYADTVERVDPTVHLQPDPAIRQMLAAIPMPICILTNATAAYTHAVLAALDLTDHFDAVATVVSSGWRPKPAPEAYLQPLSHLELPANAVGMVEDNPANLVPAQRLGMTTFLLRTHHPAAHHVLDDLLDLPDLLRKRGLCGESDSHQ